MPPVRTLAPSTNGAAPAAAKPQTALALPSWAMATVPQEVPELNGSAGGCYVAQLQPQTGRRPTLIQAGCKDGDYYLDTGDGTIVPLNPFRFAIMTASVFKTRMSPAGEIIAATRNMGYNKDLDEHCVAIILVLTGEDEVTPAKAEFRRAQQGAAAAALDALKFASEPDFPSKSDAHKVAAQFPAPFGRMVTTVQVSKRVSKTSGKPYFASEGLSQPATVTQMQAILTACNSPEFTEKLDAVKAAYDKRVEQIAKLCPAE